MLINFIGTIVTETANYPEDICSKSTSSDFGRYLELYPDWRGGWDILTKQKKLYRPRRHHNAIAASNKIKANDDAEYTTDLKSSASAVASRNARVTFRALRTATSQITWVRCCHSPDLFAGECTTVKLNHGIALECTRNLPTPRILSRNFVSEERMPRTGQHQRLVYSTTQTEFIKFNSAEHSGAFPQTCENKVPETCEKKVVIFGVKRTKQKIIHCEIIYALTPLNFKKSEKKTLLKWVYSCIFATV